MKNELILKELMKYAILELLTTPATTTNDLFHYLMRKAKNLIFSSYSNSSTDLNIMKPIPGVVGLY